MSTVPISDSGAIFSPDRRFRYLLWRRWSAMNSVTFLMLNPSIADERVLDPTLRRCMGFAKSLGFGAFSIVNLFPLVATDPKELIDAEDRDGELDGLRNIHHLQGAIWSAGKTIVGWGANAKKPQLSYAVTIARSVFLDGCRGAYCLGLNADGSPKHPLYLARDTKPIPYWLAGAEQVAS